MSVISKVVYQDQDGLIVWAGLTATFGAYLTGVPSKILKAIKQ